MAESENPCNIQFLKFENAKRKLFESNDDEKENSSIESPSKKLRRRRHIIEDEEFIDVDFLNSSDGRQIAEWTKQWKRPQRRARIFDFNAKRELPRFEIPYLRNHNEGENEENVVEQEAPQQSEPVNAEAVDTEQGQSSASLVSANVEKLTKNVDVRRSNRNTLTRRAVLKNIDQQGASIDVASTPMTGHKAPLNASASPIKKASVARFSIRKPSEINQMIQTSPIKSPTSNKNARRLEKNRVHVLDQVIIPPERPVQVDAELISPVGIVHGTENIRPKNLSQMIDQHRQSHRIDMIPERNENFETCSSASSEHSQILVNDVHDEEVIIPETQEDEVPLSQVSRHVERKDSSSSSSSASSGVLYGFNESILPSNDLTTRSPCGPPLLQTILTNINRPSTNITQKPHETLTTKNTKGKRRTSKINSAVKKYLDINKSDSSTRRSKSRLTNNKSKRKLYSERFDPEIESPPNEPEEDNENPETPEQEVVIPEAQVEIEVTPVTQNVRTNRKKSQTRNDESTKETLSDFAKMPPPPPPTSEITKKGKGRPKKNNTAKEYVTPDASAVSSKNESAAVNVYVDSDQTSDSEKPSKKVYKPKKINWNKTPKLVESCEFVNGVRKSRRTKFLKTDKPNARIVVTDEVLDELYKKGRLISEREVKRFYSKRYHHNDGSSVRSVSTARSKKSKSSKKGKENQKNKTNVPETICEEIEPPVTPPRPVSLKRPSPKSSRRPPESNEINSAASDTEPPPPVRNTQIHKNTPQFKVPPIPKQKRVRGGEQENNPTTTEAENVSHDSGLQSVSESSNVVAHHSPIQPLSNPTTPNTQTKTPRKTSTPQSRHSSHFEWISSLLNPDKSQQPFYETDFDELASSEEIRFVDHGGVQYACYMGSLFKNCGYMRINEETTKKRTKAMKYDLRFLVMKASDLEVSVGEKVMKPKEGSMFFVKKGISYSIINHSKSKALLHFTKTT